MTERYDKTIERILEENAGIITTGEAQRAGVHRPALLDFVKRRGLERASRGVYVSPDVFPDKMALLQRRFPKAIFSHESALYLHDMTDREPLPFTVTVDSSYNASALREQGVHVYYVKPDWYDLGICTVVSPQGAPIKSYDRERTICDLIRKRAAVDASVFRQAIKEYARLNGKDLARLSAYARAMSIEPRVREVMEVAL